MSGLAAGRRNVRTVVEGQPVGAKRERRVKRRAEAVERLLRRPIAKLEAHRPEACGARLDDHAARGFLAPHAVRRRRRPGLEVRHIYTDPG